jgi:hypothetical protein
MAEEAGPLKKGFVSRDSCLSRLSIPDAALFSAYLLGQTEPQKAA